MKNSKNGGQISIFLCIIFTALIFSAFVAIDISRIASAEKRTARAVGQAGKSALSKYASYIKENFGLFAIRTDPMELEETVREYIAANLGCNDGGSGASLYDFRIESIRVTPVGDFTENSIIRKQILEYMKYRGIKDIAEEFIGKIDAVRDTTKMTALYSKKTLLDAAWAQADKALADLDGMITGSGGAERFFVNAYNSNDSRTAIIEEIADEILYHRVLKSELAELSGELEGMSGNKGSKDKNGEGYEARISVLEKLIAGHEKEISDTRLNILYLWRILKEEHTEEFLSVNRKALQYSRSCSKLISAAQTIGESLKTLMKLDEFCGGELLGDLKAEILSEIDSLNSFAGDGEQISEIEDGLKRNIKYLEGISGIITEYDAQLITEFDIPGEKDSIMETLGGSIEYYYISYSHERAASENEAADPRKTAEENVRQNYSGNGADAENANGENSPELSKYGIKPEMLPSRYKAESAVDEANSSSAENIGNDVDFNDSGEFSVSAFDFWGSLGDALADGLEAIRDELYVNEYIIDMFGNTSNRDKGRGIFSGEVEYILHGKIRDRDNLLLTKGEVLLARFGLDTLHVYMDTEKKTLSSAIAATVAGWWTGGAGIPIISNLIRCGWGMSEALIDVSDLAEGKPVAFYKQKGDWVLQIGLPGDGSSLGKSGLKFTYEDYLRILLLTVNKETKISRIEDLICMNLAKNGHMFKLENYSSGIKIEAEISVNYMFISGILENSAQKTSDGRHIIKVVVYEGY